VPLHIFEPRYRELISECLEEEREFGTRARRRRRHPRRRHRAAVTEVLERFDDGRLNVVVEGRERFRIVELTGGRSFQTAEVEPIEDETDPPEGDDVERTLALFVAARRAHRHGDRDARSRRRRSSPTPSPPASSSCPR
jgi:Lon protease-like protein